MNIEKIYLDIAKRHGVSVAEVRRDMQVAIDEAYKNPNNHALSVERKGYKPTPEELIAHLARRVRSEEI